QRTASMTFDLPQPLGPTMPTNWPGVPMVVGSTNDLNPASLIWVRRKGTDRKTLRKNKRQRADAAAGVDMGRNYTVMSEAPGRLKPLPAPPWGQRAKRAWGRFFLGGAALFDCVASDGRFAV